MKITAPLLLLPLLLAACGTQSATPTATSASTATGVSTAMGQTVPAGPTYVEAFEAGVQRDLTALGLSGSISAQATTPKSYLNVLKVSDTTARAYMKTTYSAETGCALDWGDGTATSTITTPSVVATDKADHIYTQSGTYTVKLTCGNDVKTSTFAAVVPITNLGLFEEYTSATWLDDGVYKVQYAPDHRTYTDKGFYFSSALTFLAELNNNAKSPTSALINTSKGYFNTVSGALFNIDSITAGTYYAATTITAYDDKNQIIGSTTFSDNTQSGAPMITRTLNWKNVSIVRLSSNGWAYLNLDDMSATIQPNPQ